MTKLLRLPEVASLTGLPRSTIYAMIRKRAFPAPVKITQRSSAWREDELTRWAEERTKASRLEQAA